MIAHAIEYARRGWPVFPCAGKKPLTPKGFKDAVTSEKQISAWWSKYPDANIGVATGEISGITVIDIDIKNNVNGFHTLKTQGLDPIDWTGPAQITGSGGRQYFFKYKKNIRTTTGGNFFPGVDVRNDGGYIIVPPSIHPSGNPYEWITDQGPDAELPEAPVEFEQMFRKREDFAIPEKTPAGSRNDTLASLAGTLRRTGASQDLILITLQEANKKICEPPLPDSEVAKIAGSISKYPAKTGKNPDQYLASIVATENEVIYVEPFQEFYLYKEGYYQALSNSKVKRLILNTPEGVKLTKTRVENTIYFLKELVSVDQVNTDKALNMTNGLFYPDELKLKPHTPKNLSTIRIPYDYDPDADCPLWEKSLNEIFEGNLNKINMIQEFFGYCLTRDTTLEKAMIFVGQGSNGKSVVLHVLRYLIGRENVASVNLDKLADPLFVASLKNKLINIATEIPAKSERYESAFKTIVSGETVTANEKYKAPYDFEPYCKMIFSANELPYIDDKSMGVYRRMILIPFEKQFDEAMANPRLKHELIEELPGILNWAIFGLKKLQRRERFNIDPYMKRQIDNVRAVNNPLILFAEEICEITGDHEDWIGKSELYNQWKQWCSENGHREGSRTQFGHKLCQFFPKIDGNHRNPDGTIWVWRGVRLLSTFEQNQGF